MIYNFTALITGYILLPNLHSHLSEHLSKNCFSNKIAKNNQKKSCKLQILHFLNLKIADERRSLNLMYINYFQLESNALN